MLDILKLIEGMTTEEKFEAYMLALKNDDKRDIAIIDKLARYDKEERQRIKKVVLWLR